MAHRTICHQRKTSFNKNNIFIFRLVNNYPVGKPHYLFGQDLDEPHLTTKENQLFYKGDKLFGLIQLAILCPVNLKNPFLPIRNKNKRSIVPTCYTCGYKSLKSAKINQCNHTKCQRAIYGTYCISEIEYSLSLGYEILKVFSILFYKQSVPLLKKFISLLAYDKLKSSGFPSNTLDEKDAYCKYLNSKMSLTEIGVPLTPDQICYNWQKREFAKLALNSFLGKFSQTNDKPLTKVVSSQEEISDYFYSKAYEITDILALNKFSCQIQIKNKKNTLLLPNRNSNCVIGAHVVAFARQFMHQQMAILEAAGAKLFYTDTDSLIFSLKKTQDIPVKISPAFGDFKFEIDGTILSYYSLGPKNFALQYVDKNGQFGTVVKLRGLTLSNAANENLIDTSVYELFLDKTLKSKIVKMSIPQVRVRSSKLTKSRKLCFQKKFFFNTLHAKRIVTKTCPNYFSLPYGFKE